MCAGRQILLVASTDLSHYFPADAADALDGVARDDISRFDEDRLMDDLDQGRTEACGGGPMVAVMKGLRLLGAPCLPQLLPADGARSDDRPADR